MAMCDPGRPDGKQLQTVLSCGDDGGGRGCPVAVPVQWRQHMPSVIVALQRLPSAHRGRNAQRETVRRRASVTLQRVASAPTTQTRFDRRQNAGLGNLGGGREDVTVSEIDRRAAELAVVLGLRPVCRLADFVDRRQGRLRNATAASSAADRVREVVRGIRFRLLPARVVPPFRMMRPHIGAIADTKQQGTVRPLAYCALRQPDARRIRPAQRRLSRTACASCRRPRNRNRFQRVGMAMVGPSGGFPTISDIARADAVEIFSTWRFVPFLLPR